MVDSCVSHSNPLILASSSKRRKSLLSQLHLPFIVEESHLDEVIHNKGDVRNLAIHLATLKAESVRDRYRGKWILGADTLVYISDKIIGKPKDERDALNILMELRGREHQVITGFSIIDPQGQRAYCEAVVTYVRFKKLSDSEIINYINTGEPFGKAGAYAIQGIGAFMVKEIRGSYSNVVGLPLAELIDALLRLRALKSFPLIKPSLSMDFR
ncbi:MAG TPA: septum formation protein Maf [Desulfobacteraceae bacterium]|nr:septum formation protein Maf [Desulfobacteraceae bacterium]